MDSEREPQEITTVENLDVVSCLIKLDLLWTILEILLPNSIQYCVHE